MTDAPHIALRLRVFATSFGPAFASGAPVVFLPLLDHAVAFVALVIGART